MRRHSLRVGVSEAVHDDVKPSVELILTASAYLDSRWSHRLDLTTKEEAKHVLKRRKPVTPVGQQSADSRVAEVRELDLHIRAAAGKRLLDLVELGRAWHAGEAEARHLVKRRTRLGEGRDSGSNRYHESIAAALAPTGRSAGVGDQLRLDTLHSLGSAGVTEQRCSVAVHLQN